MGLKMVALMLAASMTACTGKPILELDNPWSGHHIAVTSVKPGMVGFILRKGLLIEFDITPPSGDRDTLKKDFVTVWEAMEPRIDASGVDAVMMTAPNAASDAMAIFTRKYGVWFIFDRDGWITPSNIRPDIRDFGPLVTYTLRSNKHSLAGWNASAMVPARLDLIKSGDSEIEVSTFPYPLDGRSVWLTHDSCDVVAKRGIRQGRRLSPSGSDKVETSMHMDWRRIEAARFTSVVLDAAGGVDWCGALSKSNRTISHVLR